MYNRLTMLIISGLTDNVLLYYYPSSLLVSKIITKQEIMRPMRLNHFDKKSYIYKNGLVLIGVICRQTITKKSSGHGVLIS